LDYPTVSDAVPLFSALIITPHEASVGRYLEFLLDFACPLPPIFNILMHSLVIEEPYDG
jgi:hypothetical protein